MAKNSPLAKAKKVKDSDLDEHQMWLLSDGHCFRNQVVRYCAMKEEAGLFPNVHFAGGNLDTLKNLIRKSNGYTFVPALFVEYLSETEKRDHVRPFERPVPSREISLIYRRDQWKADILDALEAVIRDALPRGLKQEHDPKGQDVIPIE